MYMNVSVENDYSQKSCDTCRCKKKSLLLLLSVKRVSIA